MDRGYVGGFHEFGWCFTGGGFLAVELLRIEDVQTFFIVAIVLDIYACEYQPTLTAMFSVERCTGIEDTAFQAVQKPWYGLDRRLHKAALSTDLETLLLA